MALLPRLASPACASWPWALLALADCGSHTIRCLSPEGVVRTVAGAAGKAGSADGLGPAARFCCPLGLAAAPDGCLFVADSENHTIRCISAGGEGSTVAGSAGLQGSADGQGSAASFSCPHGLALGLNGSLYVADEGSHTIRCVSAEGLVCTLAGIAGQVGCMSVLGAAARFCRPTGVAVGLDGSLYVTDEHSVRRVR